MLPQIKKSSTQNMCEVKIASEKLKNNLISPLRKVFNHIWKSWIEYSVYLKVKRTHSQSFNTLFARSTAFLCVHDARLWSIWINDQNMEQNHVEVSKQYLVKDEKKLKQ